MLVHWVSFWLLVFRGRYILFEVWKCICLRTWQPSHSQRWSLHFSSHCCSLFSDIFGWFSKFFFDIKALTKESIDVYLWKRHTSLSLCTDTLKIWLAVIQHWSWSLAVVHCAPPSYFIHSFYSSRVYLHGSYIKIILNYFNRAPDAALQFLLNIKVYIICRAKG